MTAWDALASLRPRQWTKNVLVFAALVFSGHAFNPGDVARTAAAFCLFCLLSGAVYVLNDIVDIEKDRAHPVKRNRPLPSGRLSVRAAWVLVILFGPGILAVAAFFDPRFACAAFIYFSLQISYSLALKNIVILDVFVISFGFVLRVVAGALPIGVVISNWILICTMLLALFLALSKRRHEIILLEDRADAHRLILREYTPYLLDQMIGVVTSATLVAYMVFTLTTETIAKFGPHMVLTVPFVLYGIFRYLYLVHTKKSGGMPEETLLADLPLQIDILAYGIVSVLIIYF